MVTIVPLPLELLETFAAAATGAGVSTTGAAGAGGGVTGAAATGVDVGAGVAADPSALIIASSVPTATV